MNKKEFKRRKSEVTSVGDAMKELFRVYKTEGKFDEARLISSWEKLMGKPIANRTKRMFIKNEVLFIELTSAPLKHELNLSKERILNLFQQEFGKAIVHEIIFM